MSASLTRFVRCGLATFALIVSAILPVRAEVISISAADFQLFCPPDPSECATNAKDFRFNNGLLIPTDLSRFYANVPFPTNGQRVCSFTIVYQDINAGNPLVGRLLKKSSLAGTNPTGPFIVMASVQSGPGVVNTVRRTGTTIINQPVITKGAAFYIAEFVVQTINTNFLGVVIDYRPTCP